MASGRYPKKSKKNRKDLRYLYSKGENLELIKEIIQQVGNADVSTEQLVALVGVNTGDRGYLKPGVALTKVMTEDLNSFRKMVETVYETMTQDISDVLANEQMELAKMYDEKHRETIEKIIDSCKKIKTIYPGFNFEEYYDSPEQYLKNAFIVPEMPEEEEFDMVKRHLAFHRLQWMNSEGQRLKAENGKLQKRLAEMKKEQRFEMKKAVRKEVEAEQVHQRLIEYEKVLNDKLENLMCKIKNLMIEDERAMTKQKNVQAKRLGDLRDKERSRLKRRHPQRSNEKRDWNVDVAQKIETAQLARHLQSEISRISLSKRDDTSITDVTDRFRNEHFDELNESIVMINGDGLSRKTYIKNNNFQ